MMKKAAEAYGLVPPHLLHDTEVRFSEETAKTLWSELPVGNLDWESKLMNSATLFGRPVRRDDTIPYGEFQFRKCERLS